MKRRDFLRNAAMVSAAAALGGGVPPTALARPKGGSILDLPAADAPIDTVVVVMMENRSFDHYLGWLANDEGYLEEGRSLWGSRFRIDGSTNETYLRPNGTAVATYPLTEIGEDNPWRGCGHPDPGHGFTSGRRQRDGGFLAAGSGNDEYALGWFGPDDLDFYSAISRRFTVLDRYHCSLLGPTFPNREYLHSGQSGGLKNNAFPQQVGFPDGFPWETIWDRFTAANVPARYYFVDLPVLALWGQRLVPYVSLLANYFTDAAAGQLPNVVFVDPGFVGETRTDEHPHGDVRDGQRLVHNVIKAFIESPHWERGAVILTYDEWGGFYDHVRPPRLPDDRAKGRDDENDFGQAGFRVPTRLISPYARRNFVDHRLYDHASILRFLEWRFLGATAEGKGKHGDSWFLTTRDRHANNIGWSLLPDNPDPEFDPGSPDSATSPPCGAGAAAFSARSAAPVPDHDLVGGLELGTFQGYPIGNWIP